MSNPLYQQFQQNNPPNILQQFQQFRQAFRGDPKQEVQRLLQSGRMTQEQYNQLQGPAQMLYKMLFK